MLKSDVSDKKGADITAYLQIVTQSNQRPFENLRNRRRKSF